MVTIELTPEEAILVQRWLSVLNFRGTVTDMRQILAAYDIIQAKFTAAIEKSQAKEPTKKG